MAVADFEKADGLSVAGDLDLRGTSIRTLPDDLSVGGDLDLRGAAVETPPGDLFVGGTLYLNGGNVKGPSLGGRPHVDGPAMSSLPPERETGLAATGKKARGRSMDRGMGR